MSDANESGPYRSVVAVCPQCATLMETRGIPKEEVNGDIVEVQVDVCPQCAGIWIDGDDGNVRTLTRTTLAAETPRMTGTEDEDARPTCPRDGVPLDLDFTQKGAVLYRCETCDGAFVSRPQAERLVRAAGGEEDFKRAIAMYKERNKPSS